MADAPHAPDFSAYDALPVSVWVEDWRDVIERISALRASGVSNIETYLSDHPVFVREAVRAVRILDVNQATVKLLEAPDRAAILESLETFFKSDQALDGFSREIVALWNGAREFQTEESIETYSGRPLDVHLTMSFPTDPYSSVVLVTLVDITERRRVERKLLERQALLTTAQRMAGMGTWIMDLDAGTLHWSDATCDLFGVAPDEFEGTREAFERMIVPQDLERLRSAIKQGDESGEVIEVEYRIHRADGAIRWMYERGVFERDAEGHPVRRLGLVMDVTDRKEAQAELKSTEALLRMATRMSRLGAWEVDVATKSVTWSDELHELLDLPTDVDPNLDTLQLYTDEYRSRVENALHDCIEHGKPADLIAQLRTHTGRLIWARVVMEPVFDSEGAVRRVRGAFQDITAQQQLGAQLQRIDELRRMASKLVKLGAWELDVETMGIMWSDDLTEILEYPPGYTPTLAEALSLYAEQDLPQVRRVLESVITTGAPADVTVRIFTRSGKRLWVRVNAEGVKDDEGRVVRVRGAVQDVSERVAAEEAIERSEARFKQLADAMPIIVWTSNPDGSLEFTNQAFAEYSGLKPEESAAEAWLRTIHPDDLPRNKDEWVRASASGDRHQIELQMKRAADDTYRWHMIEAVPVRDEGGSISRWYGTATDIDHTKRLEEEARTLAERLTSTIESITDAFFTLDHDWRFTYINQEAERLLRRPREAFLGRSVWNEFPEAVDSLFYTEYHRAVDSRITVSFEAEFEPLETWFTVTAYPSADGLTVYFRDITETRATQDALRLSEERFRLVSRATSDAIWDWNILTNDLWWSEGFEAMFGYHRGEVDPFFASWTALVHPDDYEEIVSDLKKALAENRDSWRAEYRCIRRDGHIIHVVDRGFAIYNDAGEPIRMIGGLTDITEQKLSEKRLSEHAELLNKTQDAIIVRDLEHRITFWNRGAERLYGWTGQEVLGKPISDLLYTQPDAFIDATSMTLEQGEWSGELEQRDRRERPIHILGRWSLVKDDDGNAASILAINSDITERKKLEQQVMRVQRLESIGTLAGGIAHDLNNVFAPILLNVELLQLDEASSERAQVLSMIQSNARRGADMVQQVLMFARGVEGKRAPVRLDRLARDVRSIISDTFPKNIDFRLQIEDDLWPVIGDATQFHQVLMNICVNARDAMPEGGTLTLRVENVVLDSVYAEMNVEAHAGPYVLITIADTGTGMTPEVQDRLFEPFFTTKDIGEGTGLGLPTCHSIITRHDGFINVYSEVGKGSRFKIYLPANVSDRAAEAVAVESTRLPRGKGETVLVIDDEQSVRDVVKRSLSRFNYRVVTAENGARGVAIYAERRNEIDIVLTDMTMPIMDGPATIVALKAINPNVRIIGSSGLGANGNVAKSADAGVKHFVPKPYTLETLLNTIRTVLES